MKVRCALKWITVASAVVASGVVMAGPAVSVTFKNNGSEPAHYSAVGSNGTMTRANASPVPSDAVGAGASDTYGVRSGISPDMGYAVVDYRMGNKTCRFTTTYTKTFAHGVRAPKWNKSAVAGGGAQCGVKVTSVDYANHDWAVEFTMR